MIMSGQIGRNDIFIMVVTATEAATGAEQPQEQPKQCNAQGLVGSDHCLTICDLLLALSNLDQ